MGGVGNNLGFCMRWYFGCFWCGCIFQPWCWIYFMNHEIKFAFLIVSQGWDGTSGRKPSCWKTRNSFCCIVNNTAADDLAIQRSQGIRSHDFDLDLSGHSSFITRRVNSFFLGSLSSLCIKKCRCHFKNNFSGLKCFKIWILVAPRFLHKGPSLWLVNIGSFDGFVSSGNKLLHELVITYSVIHTDTSLGFFNSLWCLKIVDLA